MTVTRVAQPTRITRPFEDDRVGRPARAMGDRVEADLAAGRRPPDARRRADLRRRRGRRGRRSGTPTPPARPSPVIAERNCSASLEARYRPRRAGPSRSGQMVSGRAPAALGARPVLAAMTVKPVWRGAIDGRPGDRQDRTRTRRWPSSRRLTERLGIPRRPRTHRSGAGGPAGPDQERERTCRPMWCWSDVALDGTGSTRASLAKRDVRRACPEAGRLRPADAPSVRRERGRRLAERSLDVFRRGGLFLVPGDSAIGTAPAAQRPAGVGGGGLPARRPPRSLRGARGRCPLFDEIYRTDEPDPAHGRQQRHAAKPIHVRTALSVQAPGRITCTSSCRRSPRSGGLSRPRRACGGRRRKAPADAAGGLHRRLRTRGWGC